jgi:hypothetical protein
MAPYVGAALAQVSRHVMDRQQKIERVAGKSGMVVKVSNVKARPTFIHPDYTIEVSDGELGETGTISSLHGLVNATA